MKRLWTPAWIVRHVATVVLVTAFSALGWWQISRAAAGNARSWAYAVEWPVFAGFVIFIWLRELRHTLRGQSPPESVQPPPTPSAAFRPPVRSVRPNVLVDTESDAELAAYNRYLSWLNANPGAKPSDYPG